MEKEKTTKRTVQIKETVHEIYCDVCGKHIYTAEEYDDGWYDTSADRYEYRLTPYGMASRKFYEYKKHLCKECAEKEQEKLEKFLLDFGFIPER